METDRCWSKVDWFIDAEDVICRMFSCGQWWKWMVRIGLLLWCLAAQTVTAIHLSSCWQLLLSNAPRVRKSTQLLWHKTLNFTPDMRPPNRPDLNHVDYGIWTVIQECVYQKQQGLSYIIDKLWLLTEWRIIFHKVAGADLAIGGPGGRLPLRAWLCAWENRNNLMYITGGDFW